jgi:hypothetical protein
MEDEYLEEFNKNTIDIVVFADGTKFSKYSQEMNKYWKNTGAGLSSEYTFIPPEGSEIKTMPVNEAFSSFENYMTRWHEMERDPTHNRYGRYINPKAKWDWCVIGGRYDGYIVLKEDQEADAREHPDFIPGSINESYPKYSDLRVNRTLFKYIDWEKTCENFVPFALLINEQWYERVETEWIGIVLNSKEVVAWQEEVLSLLKDIPVETLVTVYDLHI